MFWTVIAIVVVSLIKILMTCLPTGIVEWLISKFETHSKLQDTEVTLTVDGKKLEGEEKATIIHDFNEAVFIKEQYIFPGTEEHYLHPEDHSKPLVIDTTKGKKTIRLFIYVYKDHVDVVKQYKKRLVAYSLASDSLQRKLANG
ncbi:YfmQ family protein [Bacillus sp. S/N-304-OC-R1]|uniref:YfmQ family protein n=1 Tax=Bacillus sp. S/N-304-OC-R1 TaxID=2758034 RepID=UPI001C8CFB2C|nr:YfmQ family protein [Bacillus sp. S/N-304-OC-R1]MBY0122027.1 YfmQ family protein [Bacillus sp. S/N-304-OC-R1]